jgi:hypothetical protein
VKCGVGEVLKRMKVEGNFLHTMKRRTIGLGHTLPMNSLLKHVVERKIEGRV